MNTITKLNLCENQIFHISGYPENGIKYLEFLKKEGINDVFNFCYLSGCDEHFKYSNINYHIMSFKDGGFPNYDLIEKFLFKCNSIFKKKKKNSSIL